jgi:hypothetical protein
LFGWRAGKSTNDPMCGVTPVLSGVTPIAFFDRDLPGREIHRPLALQEITRKEAS